MKKSKSSVAKTPVEPAPKRGRFKAPPRPIGQKERLLKLQVEAVRLRAEKHLPFRDIAAQLGINVATAYKFVQDGMAELRGELEKHVGSLEQQRFAAVETLQGLLAHYYPIAVSKSILKETLDDGTLVLTEDADTAVAASHVCIGAVKEMAKILGLNAPVKVQGSMDVTARAPTPLDELARRAGDLHSRGDLMRAVSAAYLPAPAQPLSTPKIESKI